MSVESKEKADQATELKKLFQDIASQDHDSEDVMPPFEEHQQEMDVLNLPPRKEVHGRKGSRAKLKFSAPLIRFILVMMIIMGLLVFSYVMWGQELIQLINQSS